MKKNTLITSTFLHRITLLTAILLSLSLLSGCSSSSSSLLNNNESRPGIDDISHFGNINEKKLTQLASKKSVNTSVDRKATQVNTAPKKPSKNSQLTAATKENTINLTSRKPNTKPKSITATADNKPQANRNRKLPSEINNLIDLTEKKPTKKAPSLSQNTLQKSKKTADKVSNNNPVIDLRANNAEKLAVAPVNKINQVAFPKSANLSENLKVSETNVADNSDSECNQRAIIFGKYNDLTRYILNCKWILPLILKMNNITGSEDFVSGKEIFFPKSLYSIQNQSRKVNITETQPTTEINCSAYTATVNSIEQVRDIAIGCRWDANQLIILNDIDKKLSKPSLTYTIVLPPALPKLRERYSVDVFSIEQLREKQAPSQEEEKEEVLSIPQWCHAKGYRSLKNNESIDSIAQQCALNPKLLARLNNLTETTELAPNTAIILPAIFNIKVPRKQYQIPLDPKHCQAKTYRVEYGMSIGKISSTCQWDYKYLLTLNNLSKNSILSINQRLFLPPALYSVNHRKKKENKQSKSLRTDRKVNYNALCTWNSYLFSEEDNLVKIAQTCRWDINRLMAMNASVLRQRSATKQQIILLPNVIDKITISKKEDPTIELSKNFQNIRQFIKLCTTDKINIAATDENIQNIAEYCKLDTLLFQRINSKLIGNNNQNTIHLPFALYGKFADIAPWVMPMRPNDYTQIKEDSNNRGAFSFQINREIVSVNNVQKGLIIDIEQITENSFKVIIQHAEGYVSIYNNLSYVSEQIGNVVKQNGVIGEIKNTNQSLHYQLFKEGKATAFISL